ncbi:carbohydrate-binding protein [Streptomyces sp. NPDC002265]|uniref:carbohydrate-binding protein n=1 Tax=Streptomyces sp. NPDC002265 TaxID=3154415 RepID=UPI0033335B0A
MTPGNNGASTPEEEDPFGYLYADGQANGAQPPSGGGYGYPNSVSRVRAVGERQYGQQAPPAAYGQAGVPQQGAYGQPNSHYAAPESYPGGPPTAPQQPTRRAGNGRGPNTKGLLIGAIAVVAAVVIGIAVAMTGGGDDDNKAGGDTSTAPTDSASASPSESGGDEPAEEAKLPTVDAKALRLDGGAALASDVKGAQADGGIYVGNLNQVGSSVTWTVDGIPEDGDYTLFAHYSVPGQDQSMTLTFNGKQFGTKLNLGNFAHAADGDFEKGWTQTYAYPTLTKGTNTITLSCQDGDKCNVLLDQLWVKKGKVKN